MSTLIPSSAHPYPPVPGTPSVVGTFVPSHPFGGGSTLLTGLTHYWTLGEASGVRADSVGGINLTDNNTVTSDTGINSLAAQFTATNTEWLGYADDNSLSFPTALTISCWLKLASSVGALRIGIIAKDNNGAGREYLLEYNTTNRLRFLVGAQIATRGSAPSTGVWYHVVCGYPESGKAFLSINNAAQVESGAAVTPVNGAAAFEIGRWSVTAGYYDGLIDEVGMWSRALTNDERTALYNAGVGKFYPTKFEI